MNLPDEVAIENRAPRTLGRIVAIRPTEEATTKKSKRFVFEVQLAAGIGKQLVVVSANELATYAAFRKAVMNRYGIYFRSPQFEKRHGGQEDPWAAEVERRMRAAGDSV